MDDKYQYSSDNKDIWVHGWISDNLATGFWLITPSGEFRTDGPLKQDLTSHCGPITLSVRFSIQRSIQLFVYLSLFSTDKIMVQMFFSIHYAGRRKSMHFNDGETWKKVFGPVFVYLNSGAPNNIRQALWQDAKAQV